MLFKAPKFWDNKNLISDILWPISKIYQLISYIKKIIDKSNIYKSKIKIICIGNLTLGGGGKTPVAIAIAKLLIYQGKKIAFLSRGYSGNIRKTIKIESGFDDPKLVGDEAILLARIAPVYISKNRVDCIKLAEKDEVEILIMDDGLQNHSIYKNINILVVDGEYGFGNNRIFPAGPLRESIKEASKADIIIVVGKNIENIKIYDLKNINRAFYDPVTQDIDLLNRYIAFAGIARPEKFFSSLRYININLINSYSFPDHYFYKNKDIEKLLEIAKKSNSILITTEKDIVKIGKKYRDKIYVLPIKLVWNDHTLITKIINDNL